MKLKPFLISRQAITNISKPTRGLASSPAISSYITSAKYITSSRDLHRFSDHKKYFNTTASHFSITRPIHSLQTVSEPKVEEINNEDEDISDFLSRFAFIIRSNLIMIYPECEKQTINGMLLIIVEKVATELENGTLEEIFKTVENTPSQDFSQDLWAMVYEVGNSVLEDMQREKEKEQLKIFLQHDKVKELCKFASEIGVRGDMLREFRFKWAREKMVESEDYKFLEKLHDEATARFEEKNRENNFTDEGTDTNLAEKKLPVVSLPQRRGKIKYKLYGIDLSDPQWAVVADNLHEAEKLITPVEPKLITGKCKLVTDKILSLTENDDPSEFLTEWADLLEPNRVDWITLLDRLKERDTRLYFKIAELLLSMEYFEPRIHDFCTLIDAYAKENRIDDVERILAKMSSNGIQPNVLTLIILVHMYCKAGFLDRAKEAFESLRSLGFKPDMKAYTSMITVYINTGQPSMANSLVKEMDNRRMKPTKEIFMALMKSYSEFGTVDEMLKVFTAMKHYYLPDLHSCTLVVEAWVKAGDIDQAKEYFDYYEEYGYTPDDRCTASMLSGYATRNFLDKAMGLLMTLDKVGFEPGVATYTVLLEWMSKLKLVHDAEEILGKIEEKGDTIPFKVQLSLCDMYSRVKDSKKTMKYLGYVEENENMGPEEFERIIKALIDGDFKEEAGRLHKVMESRGFSASDPLKVSLMASQSFFR